MDTDLDGTADCNDLCPTDPLKTAPGTCGCGVADTDTDQDGTADCLDGCPTDPLKTSPGTCGCGQLEPGSLCDDMDGNTVNDIIGANCQCMGTAAQMVVLKLRKDANGIETQWSVTDLSGSIMESGGPYTNGGGKLVSDTVQLAPGCYSVSVTDLGGNGLNSTGYTLSTLDGVRLITADGSFGGSSSISDADYADFCVPVGTVKLKSKWTNNSAVNAKSTLQCVKVKQATSYEFWLFDPHGSFSHHEVRSTNALALKSLSTGPLPVGLPLNVRVRAYKNNAWGSFGASASITVQAGLLRMDTVAIEGTDLEDEGNAFALIPNPTTGGVTIAIRSLEELGTRTARICVLNDLGRTVFTEEKTCEGSSFVHRVELGQLTPGVYLVRVLVDGRTHQGRLLLLP
ncbi:MAG: T9SS type A sorting domain-containing protein [Flavobacteriales bacterium]|nr:T9SS type A sorting domain-containing protein [Flavobacteriales bacterium]